MRLTFFITSLASLFLFSCQQEPDETPEPEPVQGRLVAYYILDTAYATGKDTSWTYRYSYDQQGRLKSTIMNEFDAGNASTKLLYWQEEKRMYNGSDLTPHQIVTLSSEIPTVQYYDTTYLTYQSGKIIKDSMRTFNLQSLLQTLVYNYSALPGGKYKIERTYYYDPGITAKDHVVSVPSVVNGNLVSISDSMYEGNGDTWDYKYQYEYDTKLNPLASFNLPFLSPRPEVYFDRMYQQYHSMNNMTKSDSQGSGSGSYSLVYTYRPDGYPLSAVSPQSTVKHLFVYED